jgi:hypothetical protein
MSTRNIEPDHLICLRSIRRIVLVVTPNDVGPTRRLRCVKVKRKSRWWIVPEDGFAPHESEGRGRWAGQIKLLIHPLQQMSSLDRKAMSGDPVCVETGREARAI